MTMDEEYQQKRREAMNRQPSGLREGLTRGGKGLVSVRVRFQEQEHSFDRNFKRSSTSQLDSLLLLTPCSHVFCFQGFVSGITGIVTKPIKGMLSSMTPRSVFPRRSDDAEGLYATLQEPRRREQQASSKVWARVWSVRWPGQRGASSTWPAAPSKASRGTSWLKNACFLQICDQRVIVETWPAFQGGRDVARHRIAASASLHPRGRRHTAVQAEGGARQSDAPGGTDVSAPFKPPQSQPEQIAPGSFSSPVLLSFSLI